MPSIKKRCNHESYFTTHGGACNYSGTGSSTYCGRYRGSGQCMGFAYLAHDRFAHLSSSVEYSSEDVEYRCYEAFESNIEARDYFRSLTTGAYVRLSADSREEDTEDPGTHSLVVDLVVGSGVYTYDANRIGNCQVAYQFRTFADIIDSYPYRMKHISHSYTTTPIPYSSAYHKIQCENCVGYIMQGHDYVTDGGTTFCRECGRVQFTPITPDTP